MHVNNYTPIHFSKKSNGFSGLMHAYVEPMLLSLLVLTGAIGSIYLFGQSFASEVNVSQNSMMPTQASISTILFDDDEEEDATNQFDKFVVFKGNALANQKVEFDFVQDLKSSRYVLEMGDGVRLIVTQKNLEYTYKLPGKYTIELKQIEKGILTLLGTKKIKVKV